MTVTPAPTLTQRLDAGPVIIAEGFLFELERRGYLTAGEFVPEVALEFPEALRALHVDFQRAGSDIVEAFTYNGHREKMRVIGKEELLEPLNRAALTIAREVADSRPGDLVAGNISNSNIWDPSNPQSQAEVRSMFEEMVGWAVEEGADIIIGETFSYAGPVRRSPPWRSRRARTGSASTAWACAAVPRRRPPTHCRGRTHTSLTSASSGASTTWRTERATLVGSRRNSRSSTG